jgi:cholesterol transport system auxiliary component
MQMPTLQRPVDRSAAPGRLFLIALVLILAGCNSPLGPQPAAQATRTYVLQAPADTPLPVADPDGPVLLVSPILSAAGFDSSDMAYMRKPHQLEYFALHRWVDSPARMLDPLLVQAAEQSGLFRSVVGSGSGVKADLRLDSRLIHLQQVCRLNPSQLQLALRLTLVAVDSARVVASRTLRISEAIEARSPYAGVQAANRAVARLLPQLQEFLAEHVGKNH